jgi:hypothetical protein
MLSGCEVLRQVLLSRRLARRAASLPENGIVSENVRRAEEQAHITSAPVASSVAESQSSSCCCMQRLGRGELRLEQDAGAGRRARPLASPCPSPCPTWNACEKVRARFKTLSKVDRLLTCSLSCRVVQGTNDTASCRRTGTAASNRDRCKPHLREGEGDAKQHVPRFHNQHLKRATTGVTVTGDDRI